MKIFPLRFCRGYIPLSYIVLRMHTTTFGRYFQEVAMGRETRLEVVPARKRGLCRLQTRSHSASLAAVLSSHPRSCSLWLATTAAARLRAKDRRLLKVCNRHSPASWPSLLFVVVSLRLEISYGNLVSLDLLPKFHPSELQFRLHNFCRHIIPALL